MDAPIGTPGDRRGEPGVPRAGLNWVGRIIATLVFAVGVAFCVWAGWLTGAVLGLQRAEPVLNAPGPPGVGLAPNLGPAGQGMFEIARGVVVGLCAGLVGGVIAMIVMCRFAVVPILRRIPALTQRSD